MIAVGRNRTALAELTGLGADRLVGLDPDGTLLDDLTGTPVDVVLDYLWGRPMLEVMGALLTGRDDPGRLITLVQIGSMAGRTAELPALIAEVAAERFTADVRAVPLAQIAEAWDAPTAPGERIVLVP